MFSTEPEIVWAIIVASTVLLVLVVVFISMTVVSQRRFIESQRRMLADSRQNEREYRDLFQHAIAGIYRSSPGGQYISINPALARIYGYSSPEEMLASITDIGQQVYGDPARRKEFRRLIEGDGIVENFEYEARRKDGTKIWILGNARAVRDSSGAIVYYEGTVQDITRWKLAEEELRTAYEEMEARVHERTLELKIVVDELKVELAERRRAQVEIRRLNETLGQSIAERTRELEAANRELRSEIAERRQIEFRLRQSEEMLRNLSWEILKAQEAERRRVSRELHDSVNQILSSVKFRLQSAQEKIRSEPKTARAEAAGARTLLDRAIREVRRISQNLRPSLLDDLGLLAAIRSTCEEFSSRTGVKIHMDTGDFPHRLHPEAELSLYRIVQEGLNNVEKHSGATEVRLSLRPENGSILAMISDNGSGFDLQEIQGKKKRKGLGLIGIRERVASVGGDVTIDSGKDRGTEIMVRIPAAETGPDAGSSDDSLS